MTPSTALLGCFSTVNCFLHCCQSDHFFTVLLKSTACCSRAWAWAVEFQSLGWSARVKMRRSTTGIDLGTMEVQGQRRASVLFFFDNVFLQQDAAPSVCVFKTKYLAVKTHVRHALNRSPLFFSSVFCRLCGTRFDSKWLHRKWRRGHWKRLGSARSRCQVLMSVPSDHGTVSTVA